MIFEDEYIYTYYGSRSIIVFPRLLAGQNIWKLKNLFSNARYIFAFDHGELALDQADGMIFPNGSFWGARVSNLLVMR